jgi:large subunit ribosomal protein L5
MGNLKEKYRKEVSPELLKKFGYKNQMLVPRVEKVIINMGVAEAIKDKNIIQDHFKELTMLCGQKPVLTRAKKSVSNFKLREGQVIGLMVTLRGSRMYDFMYRFFNLVSPRIRDFRGFKRKGDGQGNYTLGLDDQQVFPEIDLDGVKRTQGMNITFVTSAASDDECVELLSLCGLPFKKLSND